MSDRPAPEPLPPVLYAQASPRSIGGRSLFATSRAVTSETAADFASEEVMLRDAGARLQHVGFQVLQISPVTINIAGPPSLYEEVFATTLHTEQRPVIKAGAIEDTATFVDTRDPPMRGLISTEGSGLHDVLEGVAIEEPVYLMAGEQPFAPTRSYWHLRLPGDVSAACNADRAHRAGITGKGVKLVMVDSGWYAHPYFSRRGYRCSPVVPGPGTINPADDENGHGTGESANAFATAPDIEFTMVKASFVNSIGAFNAAVALGPDIISCSWGSTVPLGPLSAADTALGAAIASAVASGIIVVFSAGNGHWGFPGQHPDVISAGGVFLDQDGSLQASSYSSGFASNVYPGRSTPDVCGVVGMKPGASYLMLPVQAGCQLDAKRAGGRWPGTATEPRDETTGTDGWSAFSGTSASAPQIAGVCALVKQACSTLTPAEVRATLRTTATDVVAGTNALGNAAGQGFDLATGSGLVDAHRAVLSAKVKRLQTVPPAPPLAAAVVVPEAPVAAATLAGEGITAEDVALLEQAVTASDDDSGPCGP